MTAPGAAPPKTLITHATRKAASFLGYEIHVHPYHAKLLIKPAKAAARRIR